MLRPRSSLPRDEAEEILLLALLAASCPLAQVDFDPETLGPEIGWEPEQATQIFRKLQHAGYVWPLENMPPRSQIDVGVLVWVWAQAAREMQGIAYPGMHQEAAQFLLLLRLHS